MTVTGASSHLPSVGVGNCQTSAAEAWLIAASGLTTVSARARTRCCPAASAGQYSAPRKTDCRTRINRPAASCVAIMRRVTPCPARAVTGAGSDGNAQGRGVRIPPSSPPIDGHDRLDRRSVDNLHRQARPSATTLPRNVRIEVAASHGSTSTRRDERYGRHSCRLNARFCASEPGAGRGQCENAHIGASARSSWPRRLSCSGPVDVVG